MKMISMIDPMTVAMIIVCLLLLFYEVTSELIVKFYWTSWQSFEQSSLFTEFPSSQASDPFLKPSPQIVLQVEGKSWQFQPCSYTHNEEQPSKSRSLESSHYSPELFMPFPHKFVQTPLIT